MEAMAQNQVNPLPGTRLLVVEDEEDIRNLIRFNLEEEGFQVTVAGNGREAWFKVEQDRPDLIVLDIMLPGMNGIDLCKRIREKYDIPVIMLTARTEETDVVLGLEVGAEDYIRKPFSPRELMARIRAILRKRVGSEELRGGKRTVGRITLDNDAHRVTVDEHPIELTLIEFRLLKLFMENVNIAFSRDRLLDRIWGSDVFVNDRTVDVNIKRLREKLGQEKERLETVRGIGYRFRGSDR